MRRRRGKTCVHHQWSRRKECPWTGKPCDLSTGCFARCPEASQPRPLWRRARSNSQRFLPLRELGEPTGEVGEGPLESLTSFLAILERCYWRNTLGTGPLYYALSGGYVSLVLLLKEKYFLEIHHQSDVNRSIPGAQSGHYVSLELFHKIKFNVPTEATVYSEIWEKFHLPHKIRQNHQNRQIIGLSSQFLFRYLCRI